MREYYSRFFREVWTDISLFGKGQIVVGLTAALIQIFREGQTGAIGSKSVMPSVLAAVLGYGVVCLAKLAFILIRTPVKLDQQRVSEIDGKDSVIAERDSVLTKKQEQVRELEGALSKKHPHDEHLENKAWSMFENLEIPERNFITWLLDAGEANNARVQIAGFREVAATLAHRTHLLDYTPIKPGNGLVEMDRIYRINPSYREALKNVLRFPSRPVTPPPA